MKPSARTLANRRNARRSTGPRTSVGKSRVAKNALRHGLAASVAQDPALSEEIERIARILAGDGAEPWRMELARRIAEPQIDLRRIRQARLSLLADAKARVREQQSVSLEAGFEVLAKGLSRLDRYERRALSRRKSAIRDFDGRQK